MTDYVFKDYPEERKYAIWSKYYEYTANPLSYPEWCDLMESSLFE